MKMLSYHLKIDRCYIDERAISTVCTDPFYGQTSGPRPPKFLQADPKIDVESRLPKKI
jgi:hypothetical protein